MFKRILIANRGEIACRVISTAKKMGIETVGLYSDADIQSPHVRLATQAFHIGGSQAKDSYLSVEKIIEAARLTRSDAIHPGYGFLSERADFADACDKAGIVFIGPSASAIRAMGDKSAAKSLMMEARLPLTPGYHGDDQTTTLLADQANKIGFPVIIKASAGGGGKGMRRVDSPAEFESALESCRRESRSAFGDDRVLIEKFIVEPRHIEFQVFGDTYGQIIHLYERDCSVQRRHQKVLEEAPAPGLSAERRVEMGNVAVKVAQAVEYVGAGTVEFIVDRSGAFYFMEMNTRLQVEHPVTEMITGLDLVEWQIRVAQGERLPLCQDEIPLSGHAIEARIYAEDPANDFLPSTGRATLASLPVETESVRIDIGIGSGDLVTPFYDPMLAKLIVRSENRDDAVRKLHSVLKECSILGIKNNVEFLQQLVDVPSFKQGDVHTGLIENEEGLLHVAQPEMSPVILAVAALDEVLGYQDATKGSANPWSLADQWRLNGQTGSEFTYIERGEEKKVLVRDERGIFNIDISGDSYQVSVISRIADILRVAVNGRMMNIQITKEGSRRHVSADGLLYTLDLKNLLEGTNSTSNTNSGLRAPMPGKVIAILVEKGASVRRGEKLMILEAMKMEHAVLAPNDGIVNGFYYEIEEQVGEGVELVDFENS
jgi:3-methylcrotonyl-CoA carboxylase alpha subunit